MVDGSFPRVDDHPVSQSCLWMSGHCTWRGSWWDWMVPSDTVTEWVRLLCLQCAFLSWVVYSDQLYTFGNKIFSVRKILQSDSSLKVHLWIFLCLALTRHNSISITAIKLSMFYFHRVWIVVSLKINHVPVAHSWLNEFHCIAHCISCWWNCLFTTKEFHDL